MLAQLRRGSMHVAVVGAVALVSWLLCALWRLCLSKLCAAQGGVLRNAPLTNEAKASRSESFAVRGAALAGKLRRGAVKGQGGWGAGDGGAWGGLV